MVECQYDTNQVYPNPQKVEDIVSRQSDTQHSIHMMVQVDFNINNCSKNYRHGQIINI